MKTKTLDEILEQYKEDIVSTLSQAIDEELDREACEDRITALKHFYKQEIIDWVSEEIIGEDTDIDKMIVKFTNSTSFAEAGGEVLVGKNELRQEQRQKLKELV